MGDRGIEGQSTEFRYQRRFITRQRSREDEEEKKALDFSGSDPAFRIFMCNYPAAPVFVAISIVKLLLLLSALLFTIAQLVLQSTSNSASGRVPNSTTETPIDGPKTENDKEGRSSWASSIFYFEPSWWLALAYLRLTVAVVAIFSVFCGFLGLWRQRRRFLLVTAAADCGLILFLLGYMALLAWHAVKYDDYFAFCIGGLTLLSLLLISVMGLHSAVVTHKYLRSMQSYLTVAKNRWLDSYEEAVRIVRRRSAERSGCVAAYDRLVRPYSVVRELSRITAAEMTALNRPKMILHDIEEGDCEESESDE